MQQADVRVGALYDFAVQFQHQSQHAVRGRMLGPKIECVVFNFSHVLAPCSVAFFTHDPRSDLTRLYGYRLVNNPFLLSSEERRGGKECGSTVRYRWWECN